MSSPPPRKRPNRDNPLRANRAEVAKEHERAAGPTALLSPATVVYGIGALLILLGFTVLDWYRNGSGFFNGASGHSTFSDLHDVISVRKAQAARQGVTQYFSYGSADLYFGWRGWLLFLLALGTGALSVSRFGARHWSVRWLATVVAVAGAAFTVLSINLISAVGNSKANADLPSFGQFFQHAWLGMWATVIGFVIISVAPMLPRGRR